ncbi:hypothetical protein D6T65_06370 [Arthrobacter frigidicola]|jgi:hypothetical protein|nr:hypothetical protein D6T65_06370 [Arthrobacter frigidicola]
MGFFTDSHGRQGIAQRPNALILAWAGLGAASLMALKDENRRVLGQASTASLAIWAVLEAADGDSGFRRTAGALTLAWLVRR